MATFNAFEELEVWKKSRLFANAIYDLTGMFNDRVLKAQMRRSVLSIGGNISEGFERDGNREFIQFLSMAKGSCGELKNYIYFARDRNYISQKQYQKSLEDAEKIRTALGGFINYLRKTGIKGLKYK